MKLQGRILVNGNQGDDVRLLQQELALLSFRNIPAGETGPGVFGPGTLAAVQEFQRNTAGLEVTGAVDEQTARAMSDKVASSGHIAGTPPGTYSVSGTVTSPDRAGVGVLTVLLVDRNVGGFTQLASTKTDARGHYAVTFPATALPAGKAQPDLQARVVLQDTLLGASEIRYNASLEETLNVTLPAQSKGLPSEHETLTGALVAYYSGNLRDLQESGDRQDVTYLATKSGWDARAVAMAAAADQISQTHLDPAGQPIIPAPFYYALFRAGLPSDPGTLYLVDAKTVQDLWSQTVQQGVIPQRLADQIPKAISAFQSFGTERALASRAVAGTSSLKEMVQLTLGDEKQQQRFADLYTLHRDDMPAFWSEVAKPAAAGGFGPDVARRLQLDGQLGALTLNNAPLMSSLRSTVSSPLDLVKGGYHRAETWKPLLAKAPLPEQIPGATDEEKRTNYARRMAAQVRLSFPTAVVAAQIQSREIPLRVPQGVDPEKVHNDVVTFLTQQQGNFAIGKQPVEQFLAANNLALGQEALDQVKRLERVYQISPDDQTMGVMISKDMDSAYMIVRYEEEEFVQLYVKDNPGDEEKARLIYAKAKQVHNTVLNVAVSYLLARNAPGLGLSQDAAVVSPAAAPPETGSDIIAYPTLESLFSSMDFCACEECRSVLSPAAYLVDLLQFIDHPEAADKNPQTVLLERRPDIQHLPLTCENTNTPVPYIDLVNEVLECFVVHDSLQGYHGHDTGGSVAPEELLASPQFVEETAYGKLRAAVFPAPLPFHQPLEALRRYFAKLEVPLHEAMDVFLGEPAVGYGGLDALMERLKLSREDYNLLINSTFFTFPQIYGYPSEADALRELVNVKVFTRRVGISYEEVIELLATQLIRRLGPITLTNPAGGGQASAFEKLEFRVAAANPLRAIHYIGLLRFIRLWKMLGLTIDQTDQLIAALYPPAELPAGDNDPANLVHLDKGFWTLLQRTGVTFQVMERLKLTPERDLPDLLACWSPPAPGGTGTTQAWLARALRLSVVELQSLMRSTGLDPFAGAEPASNPMVRFLDFMESLRAASLQPVQALYLLWNEDLSGKSVPDDRLITGLARSLRAGFAAIDNDFTIADDPTGQIARARMAMVYGAAATDFLFGLLESTLRLEVDYNHAQDTLEQPIVDAGKGRIGYDNFRKRLSFTGVLDQATCDALKNVPKVSDTFKTAVDALHTASDNAIGPFFQRYPELQRPYSAYVTSTASAEDKRTALLAGILPALKDLRKRQQALTEASTATRIDGAFAQALLNDNGVLHAAGDAGRPALDDLLALERPGLAAQASAPGNPVSATWSGYLEAPENGFYDLFIEAAAGAAVTLALDGKDVKLAQSGTVWSNAGAIELAAGTLCPVIITVSKVTSLFVLRWQTIGRGREVVPARCLYSSTLVDSLRSACLRFLKASSLAAALKMTANEIAHLAGGQGWLNTLPVSGRPDDATSRTLRDVLITLLDFACLKADLSPDDERLLAVLQNPVAVVNGKDLLLGLTGWESGALTTLLSRFGLPRADLSRAGNLRRVHAAYAVVKKLGIPASAVLNAVTNEPTADTVRGLQAVLRACYDEPGWLALIRPINDELRGLQRDALVAYILHKLADNPDTRQIDTPDKLFEYFLVDVQMDACMQTSRIRLALSTVQLFIERCLMNLETRVAPSAVNAPQWEWMKRYRVWEANRKVFLWPENWLEPELRDDQSPIFKETMSELLQSDITEESAATALLNYLSKLEEIAKLEPCGIHYVENDPGTADDVAHVVARTAGAHRKYYYRRKEGNSWTPWEQIQLTIEDNPVIPVVWKGRLLLFWFKILKKGPETAQTPGGPGRLSDLPGSALDNLKPAVTVQAVLCWSEYFNGKWQPAKTSDVKQPGELGQFPSEPDRLRFFCGASEEGTADTRVLRIWIQAPLKPPVSFLFYNTHSVPVPTTDRFEHAFRLREERFVDREPISRLGNNNQMGLSDLAIDYQLTAPDGSGVTWWLYKKILQYQIPWRTCQPGHPLQDAWTAPFLFEDSRHVFYVTTTTKQSKSSGFGVAVQSAKPSLASSPQLALSTRQ
jgi:hypothetical protein